MSFNKSGRSGLAALKQRRCTFDCVSSPANVVKSMHVSARNCHAACTSFLTTRRDAYSPARFFTAARLMCTLRMYFSSVNQYIYSIYSGLAYYMETGGVLFGLSKWAWDKLKPWIKAPTVEPYHPLRLMCQISREWKNNQHLLLHMGFKR